LKRATTEPSGKQPEGRRRNSQPQRPLGARREFLEARGNAGVRKAARFQRLVRDFSASKPLLSFSLWPPRNPQIFDLVRSDYEPYETDCVQTRRISFLLVFTI